MGCLTNYIGYLGISPAPASGKYLNQLPGMSNQLLADISKAESPTNANTFDIIQERAIARLTQDTYTMLIEKYAAKVNTVLYQTKKLRITPSRAEIAPDSRYRGVYFKLPQSKFVALKLKTLQIWSKTVITTTLKVYDLNSSTELKTQSVNLIAGLNQIAIDLQIDLTYGFIEIFIGVDASNLTTLETWNEMYGWFDGMGYACPQDFLGTGYSGQYPEYLSRVEAADIALADDKIYDNVSFNGIGNGIAAIADLICSTDALICYNKEQFVMPLWYLIGAETMMQKIGSFKVNASTGMNVDQMEFLRQDYEKKYEKFLSNTIDGLNLEGETVCVDCTTYAKVQTGGMMP